MIFIAMLNALSKSPGLLSLNIANLWIVFAKINLKSAKDVSVNSTSVAKSKAISTDSISLINNNESIWLIILCCSSLKKDCIDSDFTNPAWFISDEDEKKKNVVINKRIPNALLINISLLLFFSFH